MTVKQLIKQLSKFKNQELEVVIAYTDPTDYEMYYDVKKSKLTVGEFYDEGMDEDVTAVMIRISDIIE